ncbi:type II toxin-antitoxin system RatA family toxin [Glaciecola petra]|uniref:Type II toxin-antitoxin system RatA family toxin n=1 Tax=Glaciecola petra TaxID=3075602 RepID=A0ABU2ZPA6_9ALTE|nr:type II toxin-antitoxin system RatA family toxin [Aestuariibacter sp. P117]MDT0594101.1 type II toxin-antitoxin system RatA family toxin [Aestuariibacter sp. P117]
MPSINKSALVPYSAKQMYDLVNDVAAYQSFLPGCKTSNVLLENETSMQAEMILSKANFEQRLVTENTLIPGRSIDMNLLEGPFDTFSGIWIFTPLSDEACKIELNMAFTFSNMLVDMAFGKLFKSITSNMVKAFTQRAKEVY